jgi:hypothetical protein
VRLDPGDMAELRPIIRAAVVAVLDELRQSELAQSDRLAYAEPEAAMMLSVRPHVLRDARLRGELDGSRVGKKTVYTKAELLKFLERQKI